MTTDIPSSAEAQAALLSRALPYMQRYENKTVVVKYGGHAMGDTALGKAFARDIALLKQSGVNPIVVHGGGPQIGAMLAKMGIESKFEGGLRVTDQKTVEIVEMVLAGSINKEIVALIAYLRSNGIPYIAFRSAVAGAATGAHIHVGYPSHRL